jgi:hypothetical protein
MKRVLLLACLASAFSMSHATVIDTNNPVTAAAFQSGLKVVNFDSFPGPTAINSYASGGAVSASSRIFDQIGGVQFSVGGVVGTDTPALYQLTGGISGNAHSPSTVLGPVDFSSQTLFGAGAIIEIFFPVKVAKVGFWLNPVLGNVNIIAADTNFAFSKLDEHPIETGLNVTAGNFVGIERPTAEIGGFKILAVGPPGEIKGFTIDDFSFGPVSAIPEPSTWALTMIGLAALACGVRRKAMNA